MIKNLNLILVKFGNKGNRLAKKDSIKERINILRDDYKNMFIFFMAVLTGSFTVFYQFITGKISIVYTIIGVFGIVISLFALIQIKKLKHDIDELIKELGELE